MDEKLKPASFWAINSCRYDTYMVSDTDRISFKCEDLYRFMEDYAQARISAEDGKGCFTMSDCKELWASKYNKTWEQVKRDYELSIGLSKTFEFEEVMDAVAELYRNTNKHNNIDGNEAV